MKARWLVLCCAAGLLLLVSLAANAQDKYTPVPNEELYGTWITDESVNSVAEQWQKEVVFAGGYKNYDRKNDRDPTQVGKARIESKWTDADGNILYRSFAEVTEGPYTGAMMEELIRLSRNATVKESVWSQVYEYDARAYPVKIDPQSVTYSIFVRSE